MRTMLEWAKDELIRSGHDPDDPEGDVNTLLAQGVLRLLDVFCDEGHSGASAPFAVRTFERLAMWKPLTPLTGEPDEWEEVEDGVYQNKRFSAVFKDGPNGNAYWIDGVVFWNWVDDPELGRFKTFFTNRHSRVPVSFPFAVPDEPEYREAAE